MKALREKTQAAWRKRHPDYWAAWLIQQRSTQERAPAPLRVPAPLDRLPWDLAKDEFGRQGADFLGIFGRLLVDVPKDEMRGQPTGIAAESG